MDVVLGVAGFGVAVVSALLAWLQWQRPRSAPEAPRSPSTQARWTRQRVEREAPVRARGLPPAVVSKRIGPFVGRAAELSAVKQEWDVALSGGSGVVLISGEAGMGKSELVYEFTSSVCGVCGACGVVASRPSLSGTRSYAVVTDLIRQVMEVGDGSMSLEGVDEAGLRALGRLVPDVFGPTNTNGTSANPAGELAALYEAIGILLRQASSLRPLVVVIEDLHAATADSMNVVMALVEQRIPRVLFVLTSRLKEPGSAPVEHLAEVSRSTGSFHWVRLRELAVDDLVRLAGALSTDGDKAQLGQALHRRTDGHPFFVTSLLEGIVRTGTAPLGEQLDRREVPDEITSHITDRLDQLSLGSREALWIASVIGDEFDVDLLARAWDRTVDDVVQLLVEVERSGLATAVIAHSGRMRFVHELVRDAVYWRLPALQRARFHRAVANGIEALYSPRPFAVHAHHCYEAAVAYPEMRTRSMEASITAARDAVTCLAYADAVHHCRRALDHAQADEQRARLGAGLGDALWRHGDLAEARRQLEQAAAIARGLDVPEVFAEIATALSAVAYESNHSDRGLQAIYEEALAALPDDEIFWRVRLLAAIGRQTFVRVERTALPKLANLALELATKDNNPATRAYANLVRHNALLDVMDTAERARISEEVIASADAARDPALLCAGYEFRLLAALEELDLTSVQHTIEACERTADRFRYPYARWLVALYRAGCALFQQPLADAEVAIEHARELGEPLGYGEVGLMYTIQLGFLYRELGRLDEAEGFARSGADIYELPAWTAALAGILCELGGARSEEAIPLLDAFKAEGFENIIHDGVYGLTVSFIAQAYTYLCDRSSAVLLLPVLEGARRRQPVIAGNVTYWGSMDYHLGRLHTMLGDYDAAIRCFDNAYPLEMGMNASLWTCHTQVAHAQALRVRDRPDDRLAAARLATNARSIAHEYGYVRAEQDLDRDMPTHASARQ